MGTRRTGTPFLMEVNARFWGSLQLAIDAGVDFPHLVYRLARGERPASPAYRTGVRSRWLLGDLDHVLARLTRSDGELQLPDSAPSRWRALREFLTPGGRDVHYEVLSRDDPRPFRHELREYLGTLAAAATRRLRQAWA